MTGNRTSSLLPMVLAYPIVFAAATALGFVVDFSLGQTLVFAAGLTAIMAVAEWVVRRRRN